MCACRTAASRSTRSVNQHQDRLRRYRSRQRGGGAPGGHRRRPVERRHGGVPRRRDRVHGELGERRSGRRPNDDGRHDRPARAHEQRGAGPRTPEHQRRRRRHRAPAGRPSGRQHPLHLHGHKRRPGHRGHPVPAVHVAFRHRDAGRRRRGWNRGVQQVALPTAQGRQFTSAARRRRAAGDAGHPLGARIRALPRMPTVRLAPGRSSRRCRACGRVPEPNADRHGILTRPRPRTTSCCGSLTARSPSPGGPGLDREAHADVGLRTGTVQDYVIGLPRSIRDHITNSLAFGPDGAIYFLQGERHGDGGAGHPTGQPPRAYGDAAFLRFDPAPCPTRRSM